MSPGDKSQERRAADPGNRPSRRQFIKDFIFPATVVTIAGAGAALGAKIAGEVVNPNKEIGVSPESQVLIQTLRDFENAHTIADPNQYTTTRIVGFLDTVWNQRLPQDLTAATFDYQTNQDGRYTIQRTSKGVQMAVQNHEQQEQAIDEAAMEDIKWNLRETQINALRLSLMFSLKPIQLSADLKQNFPSLDTDLTTDRTLAVILNKTFRTSLHNIRLYGPDGRAVVTYDAISNPEPVTKGLAFPTSLLKVDGRIVQDAAINETLTNELFGAYGEEAPRS